MRIRIDRVVTDKDGRMSVAYTAAEDGREFTAHPSGQSVVFPSRAAASAASGEETPVSLESAIRLALREWQKEDPAMKDARAAEGKIGALTTITERAR